MTYTLVTAEEVIAIPVTPEGFLEFVALARSAYNGIESHLAQHESSSLLRECFITVISVAAIEYNIDDADSLDLDLFRQNSYEDGPSFDFYSFNRALLLITTKMQIRAARKNQAGELSLSDNAAQKVRFHVQQLRDRIDESALPQSTKNTLHKKLDELLAQLSGRRVNLAATMIAITGMFTALGVAEADVIKLPQTVAAIGRIIGEAKDYHDKIVAPVKQLGFQPVKHPKNLHERPSA